MREFHTPSEVEALKDRVSALEQQIAAFLPSADHEPEPPRRVPPPDPDAVRGRCPLCAGPIVSNTVYIERKGYVVFWECWEGSQAPPGEGCQYRRVL